MRVHRPLLALAFAGLAAGAGAQALPGSATALDWGVELGYVRLGDGERAAGRPRTQGLAPGLIGHAAIAPRWTLFGNVGGDNGLTYAAGVRWDFSSRGSATFGVDSQEVRMPGQPREPVRAARMGLRWKY